MGRKLAMTVSFQWEWLATCCPRRVIALQCCGFLSSAAARSPCPQLLHPRHPHCPHGTLPSCAVSPQNLWLSLSLPTFPLFFSLILSCYIELLLSSRILFFSPHWFFSVRVHLCLTFPVFSCPVLCFIGGIIWYHSSFFCERNVCLVCCHCSVLHIRP